MTLNSTAHDEQTSAPEDGALTVEQLDWQAVSTAVSRWWSGWTGTDRAASLVVLLHLVPVAWLVVGGGLYIDDLRAQAYALDRSWWPFVVESNGTHLSPGARTIDWLQVQVAPLEHWPAVLVTLLVSLATGILLWLLLRASVGPRPGAVVALAVALFSPATVPATAWFRQTLTTRLSFVLILVCVLLALRYLRGRRPGTLVTIAVTTALALSFSERAVAVPPLLLAVWVLWPGRPAESLVRRVLTAVPVCLASSAVVLGFLFAYRGGAYDRGGDRAPDLADAAGLLWSSLGRAVLPALLGGPWSWQPVEPAYGVAGAPSVLVVAACAVVALLVLRVVLLRRSTAVRWLKALTIGAAYVLPVEAMILVGRVTRTGSGTGVDLRLWPDVAVMLVLVVAIGAMAPARTRVPSHRPRRRRAALGTVAVVAGAAVAAGTVVSWVDFGDRWHASRTGPYLAALRSDTAEGRTAPTVYPSTVPNAVVPAWVQADFSSADLVRLIRPESRSALIDDTAWVVDEDGHLVRSSVSVLAGLEVDESAPDEDFCGHLVAGGVEAPVELALQRRVPYQRAELLRLHLLVSAPTTLRVDVVSDQGLVHRSDPKPVLRLTRAPHIVVVPVPSGVDVVAVRVASSGADVCVPQAEIVVPRPDRR